MKLSECTYGTLVTTEGLNPKVGMIVGITNNATLGDAQVRGDINNAIPEVRWSCGRVSGIHPGNIKKYSK